MFENYLKEFEEMEEEVYGFTTREFLGAVKEFYFSEMPEIAEEEYESAKDICNMIKEDITGYLDGN